MFRNSCQYYGEEKKHGNFLRDKVSVCTAGGYYCGNWWLPTLILITRITVQRSVQSIRETRLWTICGWSPVPTNSWLEVGRRGNKFTPGSIFIWFYLKYEIKKRSPVPTNSWLEVGTRGNKFRGNYSSITNCWTAFAGRQLKVKTSSCSFFLLCEFLLL